MASTERIRDAQPRSSTLVNAVLGALVTVVVSFVPFSPVVGGAVAGYLEERDGLRVGAISGLIAAIPLYGVVLLIVAFFGLFAVEAAVIVLVLGTVAFGFVAVYSIVLSALGGYLGEYLATDYRRESRPRRVR